MVRIGWAVRDITPSRPVMVNGQMHRRISRRAMDPLLVTAMAMEGGDPVDCAILISCDLVGIPDALQRAVRERLARRLPLVPGDKVFLTSGSSCRHGWARGCTYSLCAGRRGISRRISCCTVVKRKRCAAAAA